MASEQTRNGVVLCSGLQTLAAFFWLSLFTQPHTDDTAWPRIESLRLLCIALFFTNAALGWLAVRRSSERLGLLVLCTFSLLLCFLTAAISIDNPGKCRDVEEGGEYGQLLSRLLWNEDACMVFTILSWVSMCGLYVGALHVWDTYRRFWLELRAASADARLVASALASLPVITYNGKDAPIPQLDGREAHECTTCSICLGDFEPDDQLRLLPCCHLFHRSCIDEWIHVQMLNASCPLCKRALVRGPTDGPASEEEAAAALENGHAGSARQPTTEAAAAIVSASATESAVSTESAAATEAAAAAADAASSSQLHAVVVEPPGVEEATGAVARSTSSAEASSSSSHPDVAVSNTASSPHLSRTNLSRSELSGTDALSAPLLGQPPPPSRERDSDARHEVVQPLLAPAVTSPR